MARLLRLDKFLCDMGIGTRTEVKIYMKRCLVTVNGSIQKHSEYKIDPEKDEVTFQGKVLTYQQLYYYVLHKPAGYITATEDKTQETVMSLLKDAAGRNLFPVGRLDKDTEGLLLITNDGVLSHALLSPKNHVPKTYHAEVPQRLTEEQLEALRHGLDIGDDKPTLPAQARVLDDTHVELTICEGRFHQVKRMLSAVGSEVLYLKRISFAGITLDEKALPKGHYRTLTQEEMTALREKEYVGKYESMSV